MDFGHYCAGRSSEQRANVVSGAYDIIAAVPDAQYIHVCSFC